MSFRIQTNVAALNSHRQLTAVSGGLSKSMQRLSSGFRINNAGDDAAGLAIANKFRADIRSMQVAQRNIAEATSVVQIAEGAVGNVVDILTRMKELATQAASSNASGQLTSLNAEYTALKDEITRLVGATNYQGTALLDGNFDGTFQVGPANVTDNQLEIELDDSLATTALGGSYDWADADSDGDPDTGQAAAANFVAGTALATAGGAQIALDVLDDALGQVNAILGDLGAYTNRLEYASASLATTVQNYQASESTIRDVDMASEMVSLSKFQILQQVGTAMLAQANAAPQAVLSLIR